MHITLFGYLCRDRNVLPSGETSEIVGGKGLFTAAALARSGVDVDLVTWLPEADVPLLDALSAYPITTHVIPMSEGTVNTNTHHGDHTLATTRLDPRSITIADLTADIRQAVTSSEVTLLMPDLEGKISLDVLRYLSYDLGLTLAADIGKFFRVRQHDETLTPRYPWPAQGEYLPTLSSIFLSIEDIEPALVNGETLLSVARQMSEQGPAEVIITRGSEGATVFQRETNELIDVPVFPPERLVDPTGAGDTFIGAYVAERLRTDNPNAAGRFAAMAASLKLNYAGPLREVREVIEQRLTEQPA